ncbi:hypothetical protein IGB42_00161 [Andreprevotia sp. IGB-42]|nr:hypothetical protein IGB42_00161 [Andreprevotia sp. IGB-42]
MDLIYLAAIAGFAAFTFLFIRLCEQAGGAQ